MNKRNGTTIDRVGIMAEIITNGTCMHVSCPTPLEQVETQMLSIAAVMLRSGGGGGGGNGKACAALEGQWKYGTLMRDIAAVQSNMHCHRFFISEFRLDNAVVDNAVPSATCQPP
jgi:hypothetical protein